MELKSVLKDCGLNDNQAATYLAVLELGQSSINPIAQKAQIKRTSIYNFIDDLVERGFIARVKIRGRNYYSAASPDKLFAAQKEKLQQFQEALPLLASLYEKSNAAIRASYFQGSREVRNIVREELNCKKEAKYIWPGQDIMEMIGGEEHMNAIDAARIKKGVHIYTIRFRRKDVPYTMGATGTKFLRTLRWAPGHFDTAMGVGLYDTGKVGFFGSKREAFGVLIESSELYQLMCSFYQLLWNQCIPAREGEGGR